MSSALVINNADVVAEISELCARYERALVENRVDVLKSLFWESPSALRFGSTEELYGADEIAAFRERRTIDFSERQILRRDVLALGRDVAVATLEFTVLVAGEGRKHGRQTQVWVRLGDGWRIVSAHVSHRTAPPDGAETDFVTTAAALLGLPIDPAYREGVRRNLQTTAKIAAPLMAFDLPPDAEPAPVFTP